jgi:hypothetical protein
MDLEDFLRNIFKKKPKRYTSKSGGGSFVKGNFNSEIIINPNRATWGGLKHRPTGRNIATFKSQAIKNRLRKAK